MADAHAHFTHVNADRSIYVLLLTGCLCVQDNGLNTTFCGPARDKLLPCQDAEKPNYSRDHESANHV